MKFTLCFLCFSAIVGVFGEELANVRDLDGKQLHIAQNETVTVGIDAGMGASITYLTWAGYGKNVVNIHDPGRLIQQSYYAGQILDRTSEGQLEHWSPWPWNPIQGGGVGSWARVTEIGEDDQDRLFAETIPKLWDMQNEEAAARMRQWTGFEEGLKNVVRVECEFESQRSADDAWEPARNRHQEIPALYFTRNFSRFLVYEGAGKWVEVSEEPGPPWGRAEVPLDAMGCFDEEGRGITVFSPGATEHWNFGPHAGGNSDEAEAGPCVHVAPLVSLQLSPTSFVRYLYWMIVGSQKEIADSLDRLIEVYGDEVVEHQTTSESE